jgi:hypothetical protein
MMLTCDGVTRTSGALLAGEAGSTAGGAVAVAAALSDDDEEVPGFGGGARDGGLNWPDMLVRS